MKHLLPTLRYFWNDYRYYRALAAGKFAPDQKANLRVLHRDYTWVREDQQNNRWVCLMCKQSDVAQPMNLLARNRFVIQHSHCGFKQEAVLPGILMHPREVYQKLLAKWEDEMRAGCLSPYEFRAMVEAAAMLTGQETPAQERKRIAQQRMGLGMPQQKYDWRYWFRWSFEEKTYPSRSGGGWSMLFITPFFTFGMIQDRTRSRVALHRKPGQLFEVPDRCEAWPLVFSTMREDFPDLNRKQYTLGSAC